MTIAPARQIAYDVLDRVEGGAWASELLLSAAASLDSRDAGLASEIVFGVLRFRAQLDFLIAHFGAPRKLDRQVRTALRMGIYQLRYLERIPAHAAVMESVELVKRARKRSATGMVNAVLRKVDRNAVAWPTREVELSCPEWLIERWEANHGLDAARSIALAALVEPEKYVRGTRFQDIGSQAIVPLLELKSRQTFLDLCAAPGNKTAQALEAGVRAVACDLHWHRLRELRGLAADLVVLDGTLPLPFARRFDRVLVDAPCSGTGTLGRNPEIKWRLRPDDLADLHGRQVALLRNALAALAPGGLLVYSTCSLEPEENRDVVEEAAAGRAAIVWERLPGRDAGDGFRAAVIKSEESANG
jgi:16S rRNA (cytosine967-C5)-methyltransferase